MWREFTRETPARRGLALVASGLAFAGAVGLAWVVTSHQPSSTAARRRVSLANWPIAFTLPAEYSWSPGPLMIAEDTGSAGRSGVVSYVAGKPVLRSSVVIVAFEALPAGTTVGEAAEKLTGSALADPQPIAMGPMTGQVAHRRTSGGQPAMVAVACQPSGLAVVVEVSSQAKTGQPERILQSICRSIALKD